MYAVCVYSRIRLDIETRLSSLRHCGHHPQKMACESRSWRRASERQSFWLVSVSRHSSSDELVCVEPDCLLVQPEELWRPWKLSTVQLGNHRLGEALSQRSLELRRSAPLVWWKMGRACTPQHAQAARPPETVEVPQITHVGLDADAAQLAQISL